MLVSVTYESDFHFAKQDAFWQRGSTEDANELVRQYLLKWTGLALSVRRRVPTTVLRFGIESAQKKNLGSAQNREHHEGWSMVGEYIIATSTASLRKSCMKNAMKRYMTHVYVKIMDVLHFPLMKKSVADPYHDVFVEFMELTRQAETPSVLEIGSRNVRDIKRRNLFLNCADYVGFDILAGDGVDAVGDVHKLSEKFPAERFDFVYSVSVFEHLLFPWKAVLEINKVLKTGGYVFLSTHPVWPAHELPWDFWRFPHNGFHALFNKFTGFEIVSLSEGLPCKVYSLVDDAPTRDTCFQTMNQGVALIARKTGDYRSDLLKWDIDISDVVDTMYPSKKQCPLPPF